MGVFNEFSSLGSSILKHRKNILESNKDVGTIDLYKKAFMQAADERITHNPAMFGLKYEKPTFGYDYSKEKGIYEDERVINSLEPKNMTFNDYVESLYYREDNGMYSEKRKNVAEAIKFGAVVGGASAGAAGLMLGSSAIIRQVNNKNE